MLSTIASYNFIANDIPAAIERVSSQPLVARETEYYQANIGNVKSIDDFMDDRRLFNYAMKAHGLEDFSFAQAFMRKVLEGGIDAEDAFANSLADQRYREFAETFNFVRYDSATTSFDRTQQGTVDKYLRQTLEEEAGNENQGVRLALYFERKVDSISNAYNLLADPALLRVTQTALGLPQSSSSLDIDKQAEIIASRLDIEDLKDPEKLDKFLTRFTALWEIDNPSSGSAVAPNILIGGGPTIGLDAGILSNLQNLKLGG